MKTTVLAITCLLTMTLAVGCEPSSEDPSAEARQAAERSYDRAKQETKEAAQAMNDYAYARKADYVATRKARLAEINRELDQLAGRIEKATDEARAEATPKLRALRDQAVTLDMHLDEAGNATESTWDDVKAKSNQGYSELKDGFDQVRDWVSERIDR